VNGIGDGFRSWPTRIAALLVGIAVVLHDLYGEFGEPGQRLIFGLCGSCVLLALARLDRASIGLAAPKPSVRWWLRATVLVGGAFVVVVIAVAGVLYASGWELPLGTPPPLDTALWDGCVVAPLVEEPVYRLALCAPLAAIAGRWPTIIVSGIVFAFLHHRYDVLAPDNALAGLLLGWAYLRSGSILVPIFLHALGNALVVVAIVFIMPLLGL
jgi:membrane protease YdiL (CAAX protease family)